MIRDIVVSLVLGAQDPAGEFAISIADAFKAHVTGLAFSYEPIIPGAVMGGIPPGGRTRRQICRTAVDRGFGRGSVVIAVKAIRIAPPGRGRVHR